mmetsp:Transcript_6289/g.39136  ORF Transcript_6289/g.39136 Transcript_6289/m.39136 type:complete len:113 (-) Transcript_6289:2422-2760(-)
MTSLSRLFRRSNVAQRSVGVVEGPSRQVLLLRIHLGTPNAPLLVRSRTRAGPCWTANRAPGIHEGGHWEPRNMETVVVQETPPTSVQENSQAHGCGTFALNWTVLVKETLAL